MLFTPILYFCNLNASTTMIIVVNIIRFILIVFVGVILNRKNSIALKSSRKMSIIFCALSGLSILLSFAGIPQVLYVTVTSSLHIYDRLSDNLFSVILIEQLFNNYLITSFLICSAVMFFKPREKGETTSFDV